MPLYEYRCQECARSFEALVPSFRDAAACPTCGSGDVEKQLSSFAMAGAATPPAAAAPGPRGGCCGGACGCAH